MPAAIPLYKGAARAPAHQRRGLLEAARDSGLPDEPDLEAGLLPRTKRGSHQRPRGSPRDERLALLRVDRAGDGRGAGRVAQGESGRPPTPSRQSAGRGPFRGRSGRWPPSRPDPAGGSSSCGTRWTAGRSARRTRARRSTTAQSSPRTPRSGGWRPPRRTWRLATLRRMCASTGILPRKHSNPGPTTAVTEARATPKQKSWPIRAAAADGRSLGSSPRASGSPTAQRTPGTGVRWGSFAPSR